MNKVFLMGRLTADPEMRQTPGGVTVTSFTVACDRRFSKDGQRQTDFIRCTAWRQQAEFICKYFKKGSMICVIGNIQTRSWDGQDGKKQYSTDIVVDEVYFTGSKTETGTSGGNYQGGGFEQAQPQSNGAIPDFDSFDALGFIADASEDDLPF